MLTKTIKKILLASFGVFCIIVGLISLLFPIIPGIVLIIAGVLLCARAHSKRQEKEIRNKMQKVGNVLKLKYNSLKLAVQKITAMFF